MQNILGSYFGRQEVTYLQLFYKSFKQIIKNQNQRALALAHTTKNTSSGVPILIWLELDVHRPLMKGKMIKTVINEHLTKCFKIAATYVGLHYRTIWNFLERQLMLHPFKLKLHQIINDLDKRKRIPFPSYCRSELENKPEIYNRVVLSDE